MRCWPQHACVAVHCFTCAYLCLPPAVGPQNTTRPAWLDGSLPGDRGFDPLGLSRPSDFVQVGVDENDINAPKNNKVRGKTHCTAFVLPAAQLALL